MTYRYLTNLADVCRAAGLKVVEVDGWKTRGRPASTGGFDPVGVLCHHTATRASSRDADVLRLLVNGRSDLPGPLCQLGLARDGTVYVVAAGRANHGGTAKSSGTVAAGDGNSLYIGIEAFNDGVGEKWPAAQYDAYAKLCAVLCLEVTGNSVNTVRAHKETSVTGKIDPTFPMEPFRQRVAAEMKSMLLDGKPKPERPEPERPKPDFTIAHVSGKWDAAACDWQDSGEVAREARATVITRTEVGKAKRLRGIVPRGWDFEILDDAPGQDECSIEWSRAAWEDAGEAYPTTLARTRFRTGKGVLRPPVTAITKPLRHRKTGQVVLFTVLHAPSGVQGKDGFKGTRPRLAAHREAIDAVHEAWDKGKAEFPGAARVLTGDFNVDYRQRWVRDWWAKEFPILTPCWDLRIPVRGTRGKRVIDWTAASPQLQTVRAKVLPTVDGFDHRPVVVAYAVKS